MDGITATIESIRPITLVTEVRFEEWAQIWKKCIVLGKRLLGYGDHVFKQCRGLSVAT